MRNYALLVLSHRDSTTRRRAKVHSTILSGSLSALTLCVWSAFQESQLFVYISLYISPRYSVLPPFACFSWPPVPGDISSSCLFSCPCPSEPVLNSLECLLLTCILFNSDLLCFASPYPLGTGFGRLTLPIHTSPFSLLSSSVSCSHTRLLSSFFALLSLSLCQTAMPEVEAVSAGAIHSSYQTDRVKNV